MTNVLIRRYQAIGVRPKQTLLNEAEVRMINDIPNISQFVCERVQTSSETINMGTESLPLMDDTHQKKDLKTEDARTEEALVAR